MAKIGAGGHTAAMPQATLRTERLELVPLTRAHLPQVVELNSDPEVLRYLTGRAMTPGESGRWLDERIGLAAEPLARGVLGSWAGLADGVFVGVWMLNPPHGVDRSQVVGEAELGYRLPREHWRRGYAGEGSRELLRHGFQDLGLSRVFAQTMAVNTPSRATMESLGMRYVRTWVVDFDDPLPGTDQGEVEYEIRASDEDL